MNEFWTRYLAIDPEGQAADESRFDQEDDDNITSEELEQ
jgi:hypothetical protein